MKATRLYATGTGLIVLTALIDGQPRAAAVLAGLFLIIAALIVVMKET